MESSKNILKMKRSANLAFQIVELEKKKYILRADSISPKNFYLGFLPKNLKGELIELDSNNFNVTDKKINKVGNYWIIAATQAFIGISYKILSVIFTSQNLSENIILKILYYLFAILVGYLLFYLIRRKELKNVLEILPKNLKRYTITFSTNKIRTFEWYFWIFVNLVNFYFYLTLNNGIEIYLVMLGSLLVFVTLLITLLMTPVEHSYNHGIIKFESISRK